MAAVRVQSIAGSGLQSIPPQFIRPLHERPGGIKDSPSVQVPLIDLSKLDEDVPAHLREKALAELKSAAQEWGLFQVVNHGVSEELIQRLQAVGKDFFDLPQEEKESYANHAEAGMLEGYGTKLAHSIDGKLGWTDYLFHKLWPPSSRNTKTWPTRPASYIEVNEEYSIAVLGVVDKLLSALSINLGIDECALKEALGGDDMEMEMKINYYPPCPEPELALGVPPHTDMSALTVLIPNEVPGLQLHKDDRWFDVDYVPNAIIIHIGDQLQILSNGKYKSVLHRSVVSKNKLRMSWPVFCGPPADKVIGPLKEVINESNPPLFNAKTYAEFKHRKLNKLEQ